jgi:hypothetical protein
MLPLILILVAGAVLGAGLALMRRPRVEYQGGESDGATMRLPAEAHPMSDVNPVKDRP